MEMFKSLKNRMKKQENEIIELKKIIASTLEGDEHHHRDMIKLLYLTAQEQAEVIDKLDEMIRSTESHNEILKNLVQKTDEKDEQEKQLAPLDGKCPVLTKRLQDYTSGMDDELGVVRDRYGKHISKLEDDYIKAIDERNDYKNKLNETNKILQQTEKEKEELEQQYRTHIKTSEGVRARIRKQRNEYKDLLEQKQQELIKDKKKLKELEKLKSKKAEPSDYLMELSKITSLETIVKKIFSESPDLTEKQAILLLKKVKSPVDNKGRWRVSTIRDRVGNYLKKRSGILRGELYRSTLIGDAEEKKVLMRRDLEKETLEKKDEILGVEERTRMERILAVVKKDRIREPLWNDLKDSIMDGKWHAYSKANEIIIRHGHHQLSMSRIWKIRQAYFKFTNDRKYHTARGGKDYLFEGKRADGVNIFRFTLAGGEVKPEKTLEKKDILLDAKGRPMKGRLLAVNKNVSIREPLWNDMQDSIMDGEWHVFSEADKIIARHRHRQLTMKSMGVIRRAYFQFAKDQEYHTARGEKDYLFEWKMRDGVNRFRFIPAGKEVKPEKKLEKKEGVLGIEEHPRKEVVLATVGKDISILEHLWNDMRDSIMDGRWHTSQETNDIIRKHGHRQLSMRGVLDVRRAYFEFARDQKYRTARDGEDYQYEWKSIEGENKFRFTPSGRKAKPDEVRETTIPKRKYKKEWNYKLLGKRVYNDTVEWIEKNTNYGDITFFNNIIVKMSQELNKKKGKVYNSKQMYKFIADMLKAFPDDAASPSAHRVNAHTQYFIREGHITRKGEMYMIGYDNLVPKQKKKNEIVEEKIVEDKHADISFIDRLGM